MQRDGLSLFGFPEFDSEAVSEVDYMAIFDELVENLACPQSRLLFPLVARAFLIDWQREPTSIL
jgi:hypothetical protein